MIDLDCRIKSGNDKDGNLFDMDPRVRARG